MYKAFALAIAICVWVIPANADSDGPVYTLYIKSPFHGAARIHVATFDALTPFGEDEQNNRMNCMDVAEFMYGRTSIPLGEYWCEQGRYKP